MTARDRTTLKSYFDAGDVPGAPQYADLIDSFALISEAVGDMMKSVYDTDNDGKVESADHADVADDAENANFASLAASATDSDKIDGVHLSGLFKDTHVAIFGITADGTNFQTYPFITGSYTIGPYTTNMPLPSTWWAVTIVRRTADSLMAEAYCVGDMSYHYQCQKNGGTWYGWYLVPLVDVNHPLNADKVDNLHASETGANAHVLATDVSGNAKLSGDIFPQGSQFGLNSRFETLFGDDSLFSPYRFTWRNFRSDNPSGNFMDFSQNLGTPYTLSNPFSWYNLPAQYIATAQNYRSFLDMEDWGAGALVMQWTSSTGLPGIVTVMATNFNGWPADTFIGEIRGWGVQNPGASDKYYAIRFGMRGTSAPQGIFFAGLFVGQGTTFNLTDGTIQGLWQPMTAGLVYSWSLSASAGPAVYFGGRPAEGFDGIVASNIVADGFTLFKTVRWYLPGGHYGHFYIDSISIG